MNVSSTISLEELIVLILGVVGLTISITMLVYIQGDRSVIRASKVNGINKRLANADLRNELARTYKLIGFTLVALLAMSVAPPVRPDSRQTFEWFTWLLISWEVVTVANSLWAFVDRIQNREELEEIAAVKKREAEKIEHDTTVNTITAAANVSDAAANASTAAANAEDARANSADAATNAAHAATIAGGQVVGGEGQAEAPAAPAVAQTGTLTIPPVPVPIEVIIAGVSPHIEAVPVDVVEKKKKEDEKA